jgi:hypothetical protein
MTDTLLKLVVANNKELQLLGQLRTHQKFSLWMNH